MAFSLSNAFAPEASFSDFPCVSFPGGIVAVERPGEGWEIYQGSALIGRCGLRMDVPRVIARHRDKAPKSFGKRD